MIIVGTQRKGGPLLAWVTRKDFQQSNRYVGSPAVDLFGWSGDFVKESRPSKYIIGFRHTPVAG